MTNPLAELEGCPRCRTVPARREDLPLQCVRWLFERSHEQFALHHCTSCGQMYLYQFHEILDWEGGADDIWCYWMPITAPEHAEIERAFPGREAERGELDLLDTLMERRGRLVQHPDGHFYWSDIGWAPGDLAPPG